MAISIPSILDTQINLLKTYLRPVTDAVSHTESHPYPPHVHNNRVADVIRILTDLCNSGTLTATAGSATSVTDANAFTGVNSLVNCTARFNGNITPALANVSARILSNTVSILYFAPGALPATPQVGDTFVVEWTAVDKDLAVLDGGKGLGNSHSSVYGSGPNLINAMMVILGQLGAAVPSYLTAAAAHPFSWGSPFVGGGSRGHGGAEILANCLESVRNAVAAWTVPT